MCILKVSKNKILICIIITRVVSKLDRGLRLHNCMRPLHAQPSVPYLNIMS